MSRLRQQADWLIFIALGVMWGSSYLFIKIGVETLTPITLVALRLGIGALFLGAVVLLARERLPRQGITYVHLTVMAVLNIVVPFTLITWAELSVASSMAAILTAAAPLFTIVIAAIALRSEPITAQRVAGLLVGFVGVAVLTGPAALASTGSATAMAALLVAAASYAAAAVYARRTLTGLRPMVPALLQVTIAFAISAALALLLGGAWPSTSRRRPPSPSSGWACSAPVSRTSPTSDSSVPGVPPAPLPWPTCCPSWASCWV